MLIFLNVTYGPQNGDGAGGSYADYAGYGFETDTRQIQNVSGRWRGAFLQTKPADVRWPASVAFWSDCEDAQLPAYAARRYYHVGERAFTTDVQLNSEYCGYVAPAKTCALVVATPQVSGTTATVTATGAHGAVQFRLDGSGASFSSGTFTDLAPGEHTVLVVDTGLAGCEQTVRFTIDGPAGPGEPGTPPAPGTPPEPGFPTGAATSLEYALRPIWESVSGYAPGTLVELALWVEVGAYGGGDYAPVYAARQVVPRGGVVQFRLDGILRDQLQTAAPVRASAVLEAPIRHYFTRTAAVDATTQLRGGTGNGPLRVALLAGLALPGRFLTTHPAQKQVLDWRHELLYFLTPAELVGPQVVVQRVLYYENGPSETDHETILLPATTYRLLTTPLLHWLPPGVQRVELQLLDGAFRPLSEPRTYALATTTSPLRVFRFASPAGGVDTLYATGLGTATLAVKVEVAETAPQPGQPAGTARQQAWQLTPERTRRVAVGWRTPAELRWLQSFALSWQAWLVEGEQLQSVVVGKRTLTYQRDERTLEGLTFEYELASEEAAWLEL